jgi:protein-disulfide isomerase/uncharacterized membrane protein
MQATPQESVAPNPPAAFKSPRAWLAWIAVILALAGWYVSLHSFLVSAGQNVNDPFMRVVCGGAPDAQASGCAAVLTSDWAYIRLSPNPGALRIPIATLGMAYFASVLLWYLFIGAPTRAGRGWHLLIGLLVLCGAGYSLRYIYLMQFVLRRWCGSCLTAHALNAGLIILTFLAWPRRGRSRAAPAHPSARLALATSTAAAATSLVHVAIVLMATANWMFDRYQTEVAGFLADPAFIRWDYGRQPEVALPLRANDVFGGDPAAPNTLVAFGDFQCGACRQSHQTLMQVAGRHPGKLRVAFRYYPQDPECNPDPAFRIGGHASACRAARAAEAARLVGGPQAYLAMRTKLWDNQNELPTVPLEQQSADQRRIFEDWAVQLGLDREAFKAAMDSPEVAARIQSDIELADSLGVQAMPAIYLNGRHVSHWRNLDTWDALLGGPPVSTTQATTSPADP